MTNLALLLKMTAVPSADPVAQPPPASWGSPADEGPRAGRHGEYPCRCACRRSARIGRLRPLYPVWPAQGIDLLRGAAQRNASSAAPEKAFPAIAPWGKTARARSLFEGAGTSSR